MPMSRWFFLVLTAIWLWSQSVSAQTPASSLAAYFDGDSLRESLLKLTPDNERSVRRLDRTLTETSRFVKAEVVALHEHGALVSLKSYSSSQLPKDAPMPLEQLFFIYGVPAELATGHFWEGRVYPAGRFQYTAADKSEQTVNAVAVSKEWALRAMETTARPSGQ